MIKAKMKKFIESNNCTSTQFLSNEVEKDNQFEKPQIFIERLIQLHYQGLVTEKEISDQVHLMIIGGNDTSAYTTSNTILLLAMHPMKQNRVMDEINSVFGDLPADCIITTDHINRLIYLDQVVKETLRLLPVAPFLMRRCTEDTKMTSTTIPADTEIILSVYGAHRRKDVWGDDAEEFNPQHFSAEASIKRNPYAFLGFSQVIYV